MTKPGTFVTVTAISRKGRPRIALLLAIDAKAATIRYWESSRLRLEPARKVEAHRVAAADQNDPRVTRAIAMLGSEAA